MFPQTSPAPSQHPLILPVTQEMQLPNPEKEFPIQLAIEENALAPGQDKLEEQTLQNSEYDAEQLVEQDEKDPMQSETVLRKKRKEKRKSK